MKKQLPCDPNLEQLKKQAKNLLKGHRAALPQVLEQVQEHHPRWRKASVAAIRNARFTLSDAQLVLANEYGFDTWARLKAHIFALKAAPSGQPALKALREAAGRGDLARINALLDAPPTSVAKATMHFPCTLPPKNSTFPSFAF